MPLIKCNNVSINYRQIGNGDDLVLIHGLAANHGFWDLQTILQLSRLYRLTVFDLRGHGYSEMPNEGYTSSVIVEDIIQLFDQLRIEKSTIVGHSFGGLIALHFAALHTQRVNRLVICDSRVHAIQKTNCVSGWPNSKNALTKLANLGLHIPDDEPDPGIWLLEQLAKPQWRNKIEELNGSPLYMIYGGWKGGKKSADRWLELLSKTTAKKDLAKFNGPSEEQIKKITAPVLLYYGQHSTLLESMHGLKKLLPNSQVLYAEGGGHFFPLSQPSNFTEEIITFTSLEKDLLTN